jgi:hypothetical protein
MNKDLKKKIDVGFLVAKRQRYWEGGVSEIVYAVKWHIKKRN